MSFCVQFIFVSLDFLLAMSSRMNSGVNLAHGNSSQQVQEATINMDSNHFIDDPGICDVYMSHLLGISIILFSMINFVVVDGPSHKRVRGPTYMPSIWKLEEGDRIPVLFNEYGQPVDKETTNSLSHFMGSLARSGKYCPVDMPWHQVKITKKGMLLNLIEVYLK